MVENILLLLSLAVVLLVVWCALKRLDRLLREGRRAQFRGYRTETQVFDHREKSVRSAGKGARRSCGHFKPFLLK